MTKHGSNESKMADVRQVAEMLGVSPRHIYRQVVAKKMPAPLKIGALNRWPVATIEAWIAEGCPAVKEVK